MSDPFKQKARKASSKAYCACCGWKPEAGPEKQKGRRAARRALKIETRQKESQDLDLPRQLQADQEAAP